MNKTSAALVFYNPETKAYSAGPLCHTEACAVASISLFDGELVAGFVGGPLLEVEDMQEGAAIAVQVTPEIREFLAKEDAKKGTTSFDPYTPAMNALNARLSALVYENQFQGAARKAA